MGQKGYVFDTAHRDERRRLDTLEEYLDPPSKRWLAERGVGAGWRCLDVGAGGGSLTAWLCRRVAPSGSVVAIDLNTRFLEELGEPNLEVRRQDILADGFPRDEFDLVHARYLLEHLAEREAALLQLVRAARPGGWVVVTDAGGAVPEPVEPFEAFERTAETFYDLVGAAGWDLSWAPQLPERMGELGLVDVGAEAFRSYEYGSERGFTRIMSDVYGRLRDAMAASGRASVEDVEMVRAALRDPKRAFRSFETWTAWGRRPA